MLGIIAITNHTIIGLNREPSSEEAIPVLLIAGVVTCGIIYWIEFISYTQLIFCVLLLAWINFLCDDDGAMNLREVQSELNLKHEE